MWPWNLEIALLLGIQVSPRESMRNVMSPPLVGPSAELPLDSAALEEHPAASATVVRRPTAESRARRTGRMRCSALDVFIGVLSLRGSGRRCVPPPQLKLLDWITTV